MPSEFIVGMMSGTSADGVDAALVEFKSRRRLKVIATRFTPFSMELQERINQIAHGNAADATSPKALELEKELTDLYAKAAIQLIAATKVSPELVTVLANHGQTIAHRPNSEPPESIQLGDPQELANLTGLPVVGRFRQADLGLGGQGAPLMPAFHQALLQSKSNNSLPDGDVFVLNLGGIGNLTAVHRGHDKKVIGFDTGPANTLLNQWIKKHKGLDFDKNGEWAATGNVLTKILQDWMSDPYFSADYPKSTGPDYFNLEWLNQRTDYSLDILRPEDTQATLVALTIASIKSALESLGAESGTLFLCGGGSHNTFLVKRMADELPNFNLTTTTVLGVPPDWVEAAGFAWLGYCHRHGINSNLPSVTGASSDVVLGERFDPMRAA